MADAIDAIESSHILKADPDVLKCVRDPANAVSAMMMAALDAYADRPALGWRPLDGRVLSDTFCTMSYAQLRERVVALAAFLAHHPLLGLKPGDPVATLAFGSKDFVIVDSALLHNGLPIAPLQTTATQDQLVTIVTELKPSCMVSSAENLANAVELAQACPKVRALLVFDIDAGDPAHSDAIAEARKAMAARDGGGGLFTLDEACRLGSELPPAELIRPGPGENPLTVIYYTSGSTGAPKGAMYPEHMVKPVWSGAPEESPVILSYQPLNHSFGKSWIAMVLASGGTINFAAKSDLSTLLEDIAAVRPTRIALVPRVSELLFQRYHTFRTRECPQGEDEDVSMARFRQTVLGGRLTSGTTGAAPHSPELAAFVERLLGARPTDGYGTTEVAMVAVNGWVQKPPVIDYKLIDVPELGYFTTDKPHPRGELILRTERMFGGYFGRPDLTAAAIDEQGYYHTGDVMMEDQPGHIVYLDRRNNVVKLSQGEFVAIAQLESLYAGGDPRIKQVYLYGNSVRAFLLAVVVPNPLVLPESMDDAEVRSQILQAMRATAAANALNSYEVPRDVLIEREPFSAENGLLAGVGKYLRPAFRARYEDALERLYGEIARAQDSELDDLRSHGRDAPTLDTVHRAARAVLGMDRLDPADKASFADLGGDSLSALSFSMLLEDIYGLPVDVGTIMSPASNLHQLAGEIDALLAHGANARPTAASIHGLGATLLLAGDLKPERFIDAGVLEAARALPAPSSGEPGTVLLTGANGFLGRFLCVEWLRRMAGTQGKLICVARGKDDDSARDRLMASFAGGDGALANEVARLAQGHLEVLAGDLAAPHFGLPDAIWQDLAARVDLIVHPAAHVNHMLPYAQLFGANVSGTAELIALALTTRKKRFVHVSTIAAASHGGTVIDEDADIRRAIPEWQISDSYADGYAASKWASEVLLAQAHEQFGLPVSVFRSNMILAPLSCDGQMNVPDMFTRMILSLANTRLAPGTFYSGDAPRAHYEGLPVDFLARAIVGIGEARREGLHSFHVLNPNDDGISFDTFVAWMGEAGYPCERVSPYAEWLSRFEAALRALPDELRQASVLPLMHAYARQSPAVPGSAMPSARFVEGVRETAITPDGAIPSLSPALIRRYLGNLKALGLA